MAGKKGGIFNSIGNATGLNSALGGTLGYFVNPIQRLADDQTNARRKVQNEIKMQEKQQADAEAAVATQKTQAEESEGQRRKRSAQRSARLSTSGRAGTILTSPLGESGTTQAGGKTLLGV